LGHYLFVSKTTLFRTTAVAAVFVGIPLYWWAFPPRLPIGTANGIYANACCGSLRLRNGELTFGKDQRVSYVVEHDKVGRYILPAEYVGVTGGKLIFSDRSKNQMYLRLDDSAIPETIELDGGTVTYEFRREGNGS
jgi:hypothetical protein